MKRIALPLLFVTVSLTGCLPVDFLRPKAKPVPPQVVQKPPPIVTRDEVNEANATSSARALRAELEYDKQHRRAAPSAE